jgi:hypothetical protein
MNERKEFTPEEEKIIERNNPEEVAKLVHDWTTNIVADFLINLPTFVNKKLEECVAQILGFDARWNKWEVDHCNGRNSCIGGFIGAHAQTIATQEAQKIITSKFIKKVIKEAEEAVRKDWAERYRDELREHVWKKLRERVVKDAEEIVNKLMFKVEPLQIAVPTIEDLQDPKTCDTKIGLAAASIVAKNALSKGTI